MNAFLIAVGVLPFLCSLLGAMRFGRRTFPIVLRLPLLGSRLVGQCFALPIAVIGAALCALAGLTDASMPSRVLAAGLLLLSLINHLRNHLTGRALLATVSAGGSEQDIPPVSPFAGLRPLRYRRPGVRRIADIAYGDAEHRRNLLDIYLPKNPPAEAMPVIVQIHGGGWTIGQKEQQAQPLLGYLASRGVMGVSINYRLAPKFRFPEIFGDVLRAVAWVKQNAAQYGGNPDFVAVTGGSAGGHLCSLCALMPNNPRFKPGFEAIDLSVAAAIPIYGRFDFIDRAGVLGRRRDRLINFFHENVMPVSREEDPELWELASPVAQVHADAPPFFVIGSRHDSLIPSAEGRHFVQSLKEVSKNKVIYAELTFGEHGFDGFSTPLTEYQVRAVELFLRNVLRESVSG